MTRLDLLVEVLKDTLTTQRPALTWMEAANRMLEGVQSHDDLADYHFMSEVGMRRVLRYVRRIAMDDPSRWGGLFQYQSLGCVENNIFWHGVGVHPTGKQERKIAAAKRTWRSYDLTRLRRQATAVLFHRDQTVDATKRLLLEMQANVYSQAADNLDKVYLNMAIQEHTLREWAREHEVK